MENKIRISYEDLNNPKVDEILTRSAEESTFRKGSGIPSAELEKTSLIHQSWFYLLIAGFLGSFIAWALIEPHLDDNSQDFNTYAILLLLLAGGMIGLMIGSMEGILSRNFSRAMKAGSVGLGVGLGGGLFSLMAAGMVSQLLALILVPLVGEEAATDPVHHFSGFLILMIHRGILWTIIGMTVGLGPGIGLKSKKLVLNGFIGGMIGGAMGGLLFDPINYVISGGTFETGVEISRAIGFSILGASAGLFIGLVETLTKEAWLLMTAGPLKGKQFIIYKNPTIIGSSPKCEIFLFKDTRIAPFHAAINITRDGYEIEDRNSDSGVFINGRKTKIKRLTNGDEIQIGETKFLYAEKERKNL